jgi:ribosomal protein S7
MEQKNLKTKWINLKMKHGKKSVYEKKILMYFKLFQKNNKKDFNELLRQSLKEITPLIHLRKVTRSTDNTYKEYPYVLEKQKRIKLGLRLFLRNFAETTNILNWLKQLNDKRNITNNLQDQAIQLKKLLKYRWFI